MLWRHNTMSLRTYVLVTIHGTTVERLGVWRNREKVHDKGRYDRFFFNACSKRLLNSLHT